MSRLLSCVLVLQLLIFGGLASSVASAQGGRTAVATEDAPIYLRPEAGRTPLRTAAPGTRFIVVGEDVGWVNVEFQDPQHGRRVGWVERRLVRIDDPAMTPMDLSVRPSPTPQPDRSDRPNLAGQAGQDANDDGRARSPRQWRRERGWFDVNFGVALSGDDDRSYSFARPDRGGEPIIAAAAYTKPPAGASFDVGGGVMFTESVGVGLMLTGTAHEDTVGMAVIMPHPFFFDSEATDAETTDEKLLRVEGGVHPHVVFASNPSPRVRVRTFAGPSYFRYEADMVGAVRYDHVFALFNRTNAVEITGPAVVTVEGTGWGFNVGGDVSFFFNRVVGLGGFARYTRGTVEIVEPLSAEEADVTVGGFQAGAGLRLRF